MVIIGAGLGGLTSGVLLAKSGLKVILFEQSPRSGGLVTSFKKGPFFFETAHAIGGIGPGNPLGDLLAELGISDRVQWVPRKALFKFIYPDLEITCHRDLAHYQDELSVHFPHERQGLSALFQFMRKMWEEYRRLDYSPDLFQKLQYPWRSPGHFRLLHASFDQCVSRFVQTPRLREVLASAWPYQGLDGSRLNASHMIDMYMTFHTGGLWIARGGFTELVMALAERFQALGGELRLGCRVQRILVRDRRALGVETSQGEPTSAKQVISDADTWHTFLDLVGEEHLPGPWCEQLRRLSPDLDAWVLQLGVRYPISREYDCGHVGYYPEYGSSQRTVDQAGHGYLDAARSPMCFTVPSLADPGRAPEGAHVIETFSLHPRPHQVTPGRRGPSEAKTEEEREHHVIQNLERFFPGIGQRVEVKGRISAKFFEGLALTTQGTIYDLPLHYRSWSQGRQSPIRNLLQTGAKTAFGPGMNAAMLSGLHQADRILKGHLTSGKVMLPN